jgi:hypothetical protein
MWRTLVITHRYLGVATGALMVMWSLSGIVMMYVGFPRVTEVERTRFGRRRCAWRYAAMPPWAWRPGTSRLNMRRSRGTGSANKNPCPNLMPRERTRLR